jgi:hypothetical protein
MKAPPPREGYSDRGMVLAAYPTEDQVQAMEAMQPSLRAAWNWLVSRVESVLEATEAKALRDGLIPSPVPRPEYKGMESDQAKLAKQEYIRSCQERRKKIFDLKIPVEWRPQLAGKDSEAERLGMKQDYQVINWHLRCVGLPELPSKIVASLVKNYSQKSGKRKNFRRAWEIMPIQVRSGEKIRLREPGEGDSWSQARCNFETFVQGVGWIAVFVPRTQVNYLFTPGNTVRQGCTLKYEHGRWSASIKIIRKMVQETGPQDGSVVGVDPGLAKLATTSDGDVLRNPRNLRYAEARELALGVTDLMDDGPERDQLRATVFRQDARQRRRVLTQCRQFAALLAKKYQYIGIEANQGIALGIGSRYVGVTKTLYQCLLAKCGEARVREVESYYNSQVCSQCGYHDKKTWERKLGASNQVCQCKQCHIKLDRDVNGALNVKSRMLESLQSQAA